MVGLLWWPILLFQKLAHFFICSLTMAPFSLVFMEGKKKQTLHEDQLHLRNPISRLGLSKVHEFLHGRERRAVSVAPKKVPWVILCGHWSPASNPGHPTSIKFNPSIYQLLLQLSANAGKVNYKLNWLDAEQVLINPKGLRLWKNMIFPIMN